MLRRCLVLALAVAAQAAGAQDAGAQDAGAHGAVTQAAQATAARAAGAQGSASPASPQDGDALETPECRQAVDALRQQEAAVEAATRADGTPDGERSRAARGRWKVLADQAAQACLRASPDRPPPKGRLAQPPLAVPPSATVGPPAAAAPRRGAERAPAPPRVEMPVTLMSCDATGCWTSDGTRLQKIGPTQLLGPRGFCNSVGGTVTCP